MDDGDGDGEDDDDEDEDDDVRDDDRATRREDDARTMRPRRVTRASTSSGESDADEGEEALATSAYEETRERFEVNLFRGRG